MRRAALLLAALAAWTAAAAGPPPELKQKELFVRRLLESARPPASADSAAAKLHAHALEHLERAEYKEADARLNEAIRAIQGSHRAKPAREAVPVYERLLSNVELMRTMYVSHATALEDLHSERLFEVDESLAQARRLHAEQRPGEARSALERAERALTHALTQLLGSVTVNYALRFSGPEEEFRYERTRNSAYAALVPAALDELRPGAAARMLVERYTQSGEAMLALAERQAGERQWRAALESVRTATLYLQRALGAAGLAVPQVITE